jgi:RNase P/RNase MRP subunit POP5
VPFDRARYLGLEVEGEPFPPTSPLAWEAWLRAALDRTGSSDLQFRLIRTERGRAIVAVAHTDVARARGAWNPGRSAGAAPLLRTRGTWGTLVGAKRWARSTPEPVGRPA